MLVVPQEHLLMDAVVEVGAALLFITLQLLVFQRHKQLQLAQVLILLDQ